MNDCDKLFLLDKKQKMGCIESKALTEVITKRLDKLEAHMNLLDDDIYYIEKRLKRRGGKKTRRMQPAVIDAVEDYLTDKSDNSNDTTPPMTDSPKTKSGMYAGAR